ncbi:hypothetical protein TrRE_jg6727, partial [Triparma retinervis]
MDSMMAAIRGPHDRGNLLGFLKLPLIFTSPHLYAGAISQFYILTSLIESGTLAGAGPMFDLVMSRMNLQPLSPGYESDLLDLLGPSWSSISLETMEIEATSSYASQLSSADDCSLCAALFVLYGALVVGGGKQTQRKARKVPMLRGCRHKLFDVDEDMMKARARFRSAFDELFEEYPEEREKLVGETRRWMDMNNRVIFGIECVRGWVKGLMLAGVGAGAAWWLVWRRGKV